MAQYEITNLPEPIDFECSNSPLQRTLQNAKNLLMTRRGEVPFDRQRGLDPALYDLPIAEAKMRLMPELDRVMLWEPDVEVDFLGGKANVSRGGAMFAVKCGSPIVVAVMRRENGKHVFDHLGTLRPDPDAEDKKAEAARLTKEAMALIDEKIRLHPEHWFWYNKRWILEPVRKKQ